MSQTHYWVFPGKYGISNKILFLMYTVVFFFQAEDGIRDSSVTGVQTCALPIYPRERMGAALALALLLIPSFPWDMRLPCYLIILVWTILRPRLALYLMAFAVPWGSLDFVSVSNLRLNSADILVAFLAIGWLMSWALPASMGGGRDRERGHVPAYLVTAILLLIGVMLLSMTVAISKTDSLKEISKWLEFIVLIMLGPQYLPP